MKGKTKVFSSSFCAEPWKSQAGNINAKDDIFNCKYMNVDENKV